MFVRLKRTPYDGRPLSQENFFVHGARGVFMFMPPYSTENIPKNSNIVYDSNFSPFT